MYNCLKYLITRSFIPYKVVIFSLPSPYVSLVPMIGESIEIFYIIILLNYP